MDYPLRIHLWRAAKRQVRSLFLPRVGGPEGCPLPRMTGLMFQTILRVHRELRPRLLEATAKHQASSKVFHLRTPREMRRFLAERAPTS